METLQALYAFNNLGVETITLAAAVFTRMSALAFFLPGLGERTVSMRIRLTAAMALTFILIPVVINDTAAPMTLSQTAFMIAAEAVAGALIGFSIRIAIFTVQTAGTIASQSLSLAQLFGSGLAFQPEPPIATLFMVASVVLAVSSGLHYKAVSVLIVSFDIMPLGVFPGASDTGQWAADRAAFSFSAALSLAMPFVVLGFVYNLAIGAANRAMPQLMVAFVGAPAVMFAGMVLLALTAPVLLNAWMALLDEIIRTLMDYA